MESYCKGVNSLQRRCCICLVYSENMMRKQGVFNLIKSGERPIKAIPYFTRRTLGRMVPYSSEAILFCVAHLAHLRAMRHHTVCEPGKGLEIETLKDTQTERDVGHP